MSYIFFFYKSVGINLWWKFSKIIIVFRLREWFWVNFLSQISHFYPFHSISIKVSDFHVDLRFASLFHRIFSSWFRCLNVALCWHCLIYCFVVVLIWLYWKICYSLNDLNVNIANLKTWIFRLLLIMWVCLLFYHIYAFIDVEWYTLSI